VLNAPIRKTSTLTGFFYSNPVQFEDYLTAPSLLITQNFYQFPLINDCSEGDDSYLNYKQLIFLQTSFSNIGLGLSLRSPFPQSYLSILNNFRGDYEDFG
jgi:hypothetical protein